MKRIVLAFSFLVSLYLVSRYIFEPTYLYYELWWLDMPMHFLGGMGLASLTYAVLLYAHKKPSLGALFVTYLVVTCGWEVYEYTRGVIDYDEWFDYFDSVKDTIIGGLGVLVSYYIVKEK